jgi:hypothetical protein
MKKKSVQRASAEASAEQVTADEALRRMVRFIERKEGFVAVIKKSKDRNISSGKQSRK